ncbi:MAG: hypothetical protein EOM41_08160 [Bacilli bacterium]|nr:hypothetical protein [Bacilli bacterium]
MQNGSLDRPFTAKKGNITRMLAIAQGKVHPNPSEFSVTGPDGALMYPITQNNYVTDKVRWLNKHRAEQLAELNQSTYEASSDIVR